MNPEELLAQLGPAAQGGAPAEGEATPEEMPPEGEVPPEEMPPEEEMPEESPTEELPEEQEEMLEGETPEGAVDQMAESIMPPEMQKQLEQGAEALFYTAVQVAMHRDGSRVIKPILQKGNISSAGIFVLDQALKNHKKQGIEMTSPMVVVACYFIAELVASLASQLGVQVDPQKVQAATLIMVDWHFGDLEGGNKAVKRRAAIKESQMSKEAQQKMDQEQAAVQTAAPQGGPVPVQEGPPAGGGMMEGGPPPEQGAPQGGMM